jgi:cysteine desulfurase
MVYFDHNATTPIDERVLEAMLPFLKECYGNASSLHKLGRISKSALNTAREQVAALVQTEAACVIFTSGGTEANNLALSSRCQSTHYAFSAIEHPSITEAVQSFSHTSTVIKVNQDGCIDKTSVASLKLPSNSIVTMMLANNETGVIQPIADYVDQLKEARVIFHTDAVQAAGKIPIDFNQLGVDCLSLSSHKMYGPKGCGALIVKKNTAIKPIFMGGGQEKNVRAGTENIAAIVGFGKAAELALSELEVRQKMLLNLRCYLEDELLKIPQLTIFSQTAQRLPNTVQFSIAKTHGEMLLMQLDQKNIAVSSGSACAASQREKSPVLAAMGVNHALSQGAIRISLGKNNTRSDIDYFIKTLHLLIN